MKLFHINGRSVLSDIYMHFKKYEQVFEMFMIEENLSYLLLKRMYILKMFQM